MIRDVDDGESADITLRFDQAAAQCYLDHSTAPGPALCALLDRLADSVGGGRLLDLGSGPGVDVAYLEQRGWTCRAPTRLRPSLR